MSTHSTDPESLALRTPAEAEGPDERARVTFGLYKFGQGYWVRMMTAALLGVLFLAGGLWAASEVGAISLPTHRWTLQVEGVNGTLTPGERVTLHRFTDSDQGLLGTAAVESFTTSGRAAARLVVNDVKIEDPVLGVPDARRIVTSAGFTGQATRIEANPVFDKIYLQAGVAGVVILVGMVITYWYVGLKRSSVDFLIATDGEMKKVNWSTRKVIWDSTMVVVGATFLIAGLLFIFDLALHSLAKAVGLLSV
jgi:preprotein translocase SecE subunit